MHDLSCPIQMLQLIDVLQTDPTIPHFIEKCPNLKHEYMIHTSVELLKEWNILSYKHQVVFLKNQDLNF